GSAAGAAPRPSCGASGGGGDELGGDVPHLLAASTGRSFEDAVCLGRCQLPSAHEQPFRHADGIGAREGGRELGERREIAWGSPVISRSLAHGEGTRTTGIGEWCETR